MCARAGASSSQPSRYGVEHGARRTEPSRRVRSTYWESDRQLTCRYRWHRVRQSATLIVDVLILAFLGLFAAASFGSVALPGGVAHAQEHQAGKVYRIGFLRAGQPPVTYIEGFRQGLRELGYVDGQNVVVEFRATDGKRRSTSAACRRAGAVESRCHPGFGCASGSGSQESDHVGADRLCGRRRPGRARARPEPGTPGWQHHRTDHHLG